MEKKNKMLVACIKAFTITIQCKVNYLWWMEEVIKKNKET